MTDEYKTPTIDDVEVESGARMLWPATSDVQNGVYVVRVVEDDPPPAPAPSPATAKERRT